MPKVLTSKTCRRAADREFMAKAVIELAQRMNLTYERDDDPRQRTILVKLKAESGLQVTADFDGSSRDGDSYLLSWNMHYESKRRLNNDTFGGNVNPHHQQKATYLAYGFDQLLQQLEKGFGMANDGTAYLS